MDGGSSTEQNEILIHWKNVLMKKLNNNTPNSNNFLTNNELENIIPLLHLLQLNAEEQAFVEQSSAFRKAEAQKERRRLLFWILFLVVLSLIMTSGLVWVVYKNQQIKKELVENQKTIKTVYFYQNNFTLSSQKDSTGQLKYGFIDQKGILRISYQYDEATNFDEYGFARVKIGEALYLIDTLNHRYPLAESLQALNDTILALSLKEQNLSVFPSVISEHQQLEILYLRGNYFSIFPKDIEQLTQLKVLDLGYNRLTTVPDEFSAFKQLKILDLRYNLLTKLDSPLLELPALEILNLSGNFIEKIPREINKLKELRVLNLSNNQVDQINNIAELPQLRELNVYNNNIDSIPQVLVKRTELVIHWGGHQMKKQSRNGAYRKDDKNDENQMIANLNEQEKSTSTDILQNNPKATKTTNKTTPNTAKDNFRYQILKIAGENQSASAHEQLDGAIKVRVVNPFSQPVAGVSVLFEVISGGGHVSERNVITDAEGLAQVFWVVGADGAQVLNVTAVGDSTGKKSSATQVFKAISHYIVDERDGEAYSIVTIGTQVWMAENLRYNAKGSKLNPNNKNIRYGRLYDWNVLMGNYNSNAAVNQGLCPKGWHIPTQAEWEKLKNTKTAVTLKSSHHWNSKNDYFAGLLNSSGFNALPAGKYNRLTNTFSDIGAKAFFWSATEVTVMYAIYYQLYMDSGATDVLVPSEDIDKDNGLSCRCIKDEG